MLLMLLRRYPMAYNPGVQCQISMLGHDWRFKVPVQKRPGTQEVLTKYATCGEEEWRVLSRGGWQRFLLDEAAGKIVPAG
jgi:hypothetical protein